ncbi:hypothetical protein BJ166DRAFT_592373 [Pestalotiopsis sp. NC0098]|nr:hypothetical protein BJ166DRAFT_592373 [Pestalotiopsis sp. NC0098]
MSKDKYELNTDEENVLASALNIERQTTLPCGKGECLRDRKQKKAAELHENLVCLRFREGLCWNCAGTAVPDLVHMDMHYQQEYHRITKGLWPEVGKPLDQRIFPLVQSNYWHKQREELERRYGLPVHEPPLYPQPSWLLPQPVNYRADLNEIFEELSFRADGLSEVFTTANNCVVDHATDVQRPVRRGLHW